VGRRDRPSGPPLRRQVRRARRRPSSSRGAQPGAPRPAATARRSGGDPCPRVHPRGRHPQPDPGDDPPAHAGGQRPRGDPQPATQALDGRSPRALCAPPDGSEPIDRASLDDRRPARDGPPSALLRGRGGRPRVGVLIITRVAPELLAEPGAAGSPCSSSTRSATSRSTRRPRPFSSPSSVPGTSAAP